MPGIELCDGAVFSPGAAIRAFVGDLDPRRRLCSACRTEPRPRPKFKTARAVFAVPHTPFHLLRGVRAAAFHTQLRGSHVSRSHHRACDAVFELGAKPQSSKRILIPF